MPRAANRDRYQRLRERLIEERKKAGLNQVDVAEALGKPQSYVSKYEIGERRLDVIEFLDVAKAIGFNAVRVLKSLS